ncbi:MAG: bifunctional metallophosphatase/5'-nucleotidase, partial [Bacteroidota bacterium]
ETKNSLRTFLKNLFRGWFIIFMVLYLFLPMELIGGQKRFTILHTSDEHSVLTPLPAVDYHPDLPNPTVGGFARLAGFVNAVRENKADEPVLLLSSGDFVGGSPYAWLILEGYSPEIELLREIGYDAVTIGNHEFDYGPGLLNEYFQRAGYPAAHNNLPVIISNLDIPEGHPLHQSGFLPNKIMELDNGLKIGLFGILGNLAYSVAPLAEPVKIFDPVTIAQQQVDQLRQEGADIIIALSHSGIEEDYILAEKVDNIDIILGGHDHYQTMEPVTIHNSIVMHSSYYLQYAGMLEVAFDETSRKVTLVNRENDTPYQVALDHSITEDPAVRSKVEEYTGKLNDFVTYFTDSLFTDVFTPVMYSEFPVVMEAPMVETTIGNFVVDAMRLEAEKVTGERVDLAIQANGVIRGDIIPGEMEWSGGNVSFMDLVTISGLGSGPDMKAGYPLVSIYLTAEEIYSVFEIASLLSQLMGDTYFLQISGMKYHYDPGKATWIKIPVADIPVPAYRAVKKVYVYEGEGVQQENGYVELDADSDRLYHLVADHYLTSFLPMIGEILPRLKLVLKDKEGNPLELDQTIIYQDGREFKVWEAVARYASTFARGNSGLPQMPDVYRNTQGRINAEEGIPLKVWSWTGIVLILAGLGLTISWVVKRVRRKRK